MRRMSIALAAVGVLAGALDVQAQTKQRPDTKPQDHVTAVYADEKAPSAAAWFVVSRDSDRVLTSFDESAWLWNSATRQVEKRFDRTAIVEMLPSDHVRVNMPALVIKDADTSRRIVAGLTGEEIARVGMDEDVVMVARTPQGWLALTHDGKVEVEAAPAGNKDKRFSLWLQGRKDPLKVVTLPADPPKTRTPKFAISADGRTFGVVWKNEVRLIDVATGTERSAVVGRTPTPDVTGLAFTEDGRRLILLTETGPLLTVDAATLKVTGTVAVPDLGRRFEIASHARGQVVEIEGRRQRAFVDTATGKHVLAQRMSSGSGYVLRWLGGDLVLRASRGRRAPTTQYGVYRREGGDFKMLYRYERKMMDLGTLSASPNAACLFMADPKGAMISDLLTDRSLRAVDGLKARIDQAAFSRDGKRVVAVDEEGALLTIEAPKGCHGPARR